MTDDAQATVAMTMMAGCYNLKRLASFLHWRVDALFKSEPGTCKAQARSRVAKASAAGADRLLEPALCPLGRRYRTLGWWECVGWL